MFDEIEREDSGKKEESQASAPKEVLEIMGRAIRNLENSGIMKRALKVGDMAPDFTLRNARGESINLKKALSSGPVVLGFYRGRW